MTDNTALSRLQMKRTGFGMSEKENSTSNILSKVLKVLS
jgi:hypothetical protein